MKLPVLSGIEVVKKLKQIGFVATRQKGSHVRLEKSLPQETVKIAVPLHSQLKKDTLSRIIKDAGLTPEEFQKLK